MSSARKLRAVPTVQEAAAPGAHAELITAQEAMRTASAAVDAAQAALDASRDTSKRPELREALILAQQDLEAAQQQVERCNKHHCSAQRRDDEHAFRAIGARIGQAGQLKAAQEMADEFIRSVGAAAETFFAKLAEQNIAFADEAERLNQIWDRLGYDYRVAGIEVENGTGTESIPARLSLESLHTHEFFVRKQLENQHPNATHLKQATRQFLLGALDFPQTWRLLKKHAAVARQSSAAQTPVTK